MRRSVTLDAEKHEMSTERCHAENTEGWRLVQALLVALPCISICQADVFIGVLPAIGQSGG